MVKGLKTEKVFAERYGEAVLDKVFYDAAPEGFAVDGTVAALDVRGGGVSCATAGVDNDPAGLRCDGEIYLPAEDKPCTLRQRVQFSEANTDDANVFVGMSDQALTAILQNNGAGPAVSYDGFGFFKVDGGSANWSIEASNAGTQTTVELTAANSLDGEAHVAASSAYQELRIDVIPKTSASADVIFYIDGVAVYKLTDYTITGLEEMAPMVCIKAGDTNAETLNVTYFRFATAL